MGDKKDWVDFKAIKEAVSIEMVLDHYGVTGLRKSGDDLRGPCPIHSSSPTSREFSVNLSKNAFQCFHCKARGNVLDFVATMEKCSVKDAALKLKGWFKVGESESPALVCSAGVRSLISELEGHASQIAYHSSLFEAKLAALKALVAADEKRK